MFGSRERREPERGRDLSLEIEISLEEAAAGVDKEISLNRARDLPGLPGRQIQAGNAPFDLRLMRRPRARSATHQGFFTLARTCPQCRGAGETSSRRPAKRAAERALQRNKNPSRSASRRASRTACRLRLAGEGEAGGGTIRPGDLYVGIKVKPHDFFGREENHLVAEIMISAVQAALGITVEIPTLDAIEKLRVPPGTQSGEVFRLKGRGIKEMNSRRLGDLFVKVTVRTPDGLSRDEKALLRQLGEMRGEDLEVIPKSKVVRTRPKER